MGGFYLPGALVVLGLAVLCAGTSAVPFQGEEVYVEVYNELDDFLGWWQSCGDASDDKKPHVCAYNQKRSVYIGRYGDITGRNSLSFILEPPSNDITEDIFACPCNHAGTISWVKGDNKYITGDDQADWDLGAPIKYNTSYEVTNHRRKDVLSYLPDGDKACRKDEGKYCLTTKGYNHIRIKIQNLNSTCTANQVSGQWVYQYTIASATTESWQEGTDKKHDESKTSTWSESVTQSAEIGWAFGEATISASIAHSTANTYSNEWSSSHQHGFSITWGRKDIGKAAWQFQFSESDTCHHTEESATHEYAITEGAWRLPCCVPGYSTDAPYYTTCHTKDAMTQDGETLHGCKVQGSGDLIVT